MMLDERESLFTKLENAPTEETVAGNRNRQPITDPTTTESPIRGSESDKRTATDLGVTPLLSASYALSLPRKGQEMFAVGDFDDSGRRRQVASRFSQTRATGLDRGPIDHCGAGRVNPFYTADIQWHNHLAATATDLQATDILMRASLSEQIRPGSRFTASRDLPLHPANIWRAEGGASSGNRTRDLVPGSGLLKCHRGFERLDGFF